MNNSIVMDVTSGNYGAGYNGYNIIYPYPGWPNIPIPYQWPNTATITWPSLDETRIAALEARLAKMERENRRLKRGLGRLYRERRQQQQQQAEAK